MTSSNLNIARHESGMLNAASDASSIEDSVVDTFESEYSDMLQGIRSTFNSGKTKDVEWRVQQLQVLRQAIVDNVDNIIEALYSDLGRPRFEGALAEVTTTLQEVDFFLNNIHEFVKPARPWTPLLNQPGSSAIMPQPKGVVLILSPWNFPIQLILMPLIAAIAAGNCSVIKPSEVAPECAKVSERIVSRLDQSCFRVVQGAIHETTALLRLKWDHIVYTGNGAVARIVCAAAAKHLTPVTLELGGKSPVIVDSSCNLKVTAKRLLNGKLLNASQICIAPDYVLVEEKIKGKFINELLATMKQFLGDHPEESKSFARIINERHFDRILRLRDSSKHKGEMLVVDSSEVPNRAKKYIPPTLIVEPDVNSPLMQEEIFGPLLPIIGVKDIPQAVDFVNSRENPLALYIFAENSDVQSQILENTMSGGCCVNDTIYQVTSPYLPFGGIGSSGHGAYHGKSGFDELSHQKSVLFRSTWLDPSIRYPPYDDAKVKGVLKFASSPGLPPRTKKLLAAGAVGLIGATILSRL